MRDRVQLLVWALLSFAFVLRLAFIFTQPATPPFWDEVFYGHRARAYQQGWASLVGSSDGPTLLDAFRGSLQKGEAYAAAVGLLYCIADAPRAVFAVQALFDTVTCGLLFGLARALSGVRAGVIALVLAALYEPAIFAAARLQTETLASLLCVAAVWAICVPARRPRLGTFLGGTLVAFSMLTRPVFQFLFFVLLPSVVVRNWHRPWPTRLTLAAIFAAGFFAVVAPRMILTKAVTGAALWSVTMDPSDDTYAGAMLSNAGWKTDRQSFLHPPREELLALMGADASRRPQPADLQAASRRTWTLHPVDSAAVAFHKLYVAWLYPYNDARWTFLTSSDGMAAFHRIMLLLALAGMPLALRCWPVGIPLLAATLYSWLAFAATKIEVRYAATAMPMMICFAGVALAELSAGCVCAWRAGRRRRLALLATAAAAGVIGAQLLTTGRILQLLPLAPDAAHGVRVAVLLIAIVALAGVTAELGFSTRRRAAVLTLLAPSVAIAALVVLAGRPFAQTWREWQCTLRPNRGIASLEFVVPRGVEAPLSAQLRLDLLPDRAGYDVVVRVNGQEVRRYRDGLTRADADLPHRVSYRDIFAAQRRGSEADKAWYIVPLPPERIVPGARLAVEVALDGEDASRGSMAIFGDYPPDRSTYAGPSLLSPRDNADTSLSKYLADGDFRMRRRVPLAGTSHSRFYDGSTWSDTDLGFDPGRQQGRYRIFLVLRYDRGMVIL